MRRAELAVYAPHLQRLKLDCRCKFTGRVRQKRSPAPFRTGETVVWPICSQCGKVVLEVRRPAVVESVSVKRLERAERMVEELAERVGATQQSRADRQPSARDARARLRVVPRSE